MILINNIVNICFRVKMYSAPCGLAFVTKSHAGAAGSGDVCPNTHQHAVHHKEIRYGETSASDMGRTT